MTIYLFLIIVREVEVARVDRFEENGAGVVIVNRGEF